MALEVAESTASSQADVINGQRRRCRDDGRGECHARKKGDVKLEVFMRVFI